MFQITVRYFYILLIVILFSLLSCSNDLITDTDVILLEDDIPPEIKVFTPLNNGYYGSTILVDGEIKDMADDHRASGKVKSLVYQVLGTARKGNVHFKKDGSFCFTFFSGDFEGEKTLTLTGTDWNKNKKIKRITLSKGAFHTFSCTPGNKEITLDWDTAPHVQSYTLYYTNNGTTPSVTNGISVGNVTPPYIIEDLSNGLLYSVLIRGNTGGSVDDWSLVKQTIPLSPFTLAPRVKGDYAKISIAWTKIPGADHYIVLRSTSKNGPFAALPAQQSSSYYIDTGVTTGQPYYYRIKPVLEGCIESEATYGETSPFPPFASKISSCQTNGFAYRIAVKDQYAYVVNHNKGLSVINIADPKAPWVAGNCKIPGNAYDICIKDTFAYVAADNGGLCIVNISTPVTPQLTKVFTTIDYARALEIKDNHAYVAIGDSGLQIIDISSPANPQHVALYDTGGTALGITIEEDYAYIAAGDAGLVVVAIATPSDPVPAGSRNTPDMAYDVVIKDTLAYVADDASDLQIFDISTPSSITFVGSYNDQGPGGSRGVALSGIYAYIASTQGGILAINIADPEHPVKVDSYDSITTANGIVVQGEYGFVAAHNEGFHVINLAEPAPADASSTGSTNGRAAKGVTVDGEYAYVAASEEGMMIFDITTPENPFCIASVSMPENKPVWNTTICGHYAFLTGYDVGLEILDVSDPFMCGYYSTIEIQNITTGAELRGDYIYVSYWNDNTGESGIKVYDISDPAEPVYIDSYKAEGYARDVAVYGEYAYIADDVKNWMKIVHIAGQSSPPSSALYSTLGEATGVNVWGTNASIANGHSGVLLLDITEPLFPELLGTYDTEDFAYDCDWYGRYLFIADGLKGLQIIDKKQPGALVFAGSYDIPGVESQKIVVRGCYAYIAAGSTGLKIVDLWKYDNP
ncbi:MAG: hypothetical protein JXB88_27090 [Spirochaetales bacterium]|nr:hypothetical protein [Spirochaetales bacterium]